MPDLVYCSECGAALTSAHLPVLCTRCALRGALELSDDRTKVVPPFPLAPASDERIGRYKLLGKIGEGGCGVVYMAEQEEPVRRRVALKVIKPGMDTKEVIARFEAERQALALMEHPNIAKVFDGGTTESGRPYFVMELVRGLRITEYCDEKKLATSQRLGLFVQVCHAVQHAHQKGIIHRDLKPSNILVMMTDGVAVPKVIDFGIAKATGQPLTDKTYFTEFHRIIGTPAYMSPEQTDLTSVDIDTRSDVYSLGVVLYELATGRTPFDTQQLLRAGVAEMLQAIRVTEPLRPSARLSQLPATELKTVAWQRQTDSPGLVRSLRGDLDWIVMKCLEKDRARRYETASALALDLHRHLSHEPVVARPPTTLYRAQRFLQRNKGPVAVALTVTMALVAGVVASTWQWRKAVLAQRSEQEQRNLAERKSIEEAKAHAEANRQKQIAVKEQQRAEDSLVRIQLQRAEELLAVDDDPAALAMLSRVLRTSPSNSVAAQRIVSALSLGNFPLDDPLPGSPTAGRLVVQNTNGGLQVVSAANGEPTGPRLADVAHNRDYLRVSFSEDGRRVVAMARDEVHIWEAASGKLVYRSPQREPQPFGFVALPGRWRWSIGKTADRPYSTNVVVVDVLAGNARALTAANVSPVGFQGYELTSSNGRWLALWSKHGTTATLFETGSDLSAPTTLALGMAAERLIFSPNGARIASLLGGWVRIWDTKSGQMLSETGNTTNGPSSTTNRVESLAFSPEADRYAITRGGRTVAILDTRKSVPTAPLLRHPMRVNSVRFGSTGEQLITIDAGNNLRVWNCDTAEQVGAAVPHQDFVIALVFSPDGEHCATDSADRTVRITRLRDGKVAGEIQRHRSQLSNFSFSPDGRCLLTETSQGIVRVWATHSGEPITRPVRRPPRRFPFIHEGRKVVAADPALMEWNWNEPTGESFPIQFSPGLAIDFAEVDKFGKVALVLSGSGNGKNLQVWDLEIGKLRFGSLPGQLDARLSPNGRNLLTRRGSQRVRLLDPPEENPTSLSVDRRYAANSATRNLAAPQSVRKVQTTATDECELIDTATGTAIAVLEHDSLGGFAYGVDGQRIITWSSTVRGTNRIGVRLWNGATGEIIKELSGRSQIAGRPTFSPDGTAIITAVLDGVASWDARSGEFLRQVATTHVELINGNFSPNGQRYFETSGRLVWNFGGPDRRPVRLPVADSPAAGAAVFSPDGAKLIGKSSGSECYIWSADSGKVLAGPMQHQGRIQWFGFSPDGRAAATSSDDATARIWETEGGLPMSEPLWHGAEVSLGAFDSESHRLFTASRDGAVRLWDVASGLTISPALPHEGAVRFLHVTSDGRRVITTTSRTLRVWDVGAAHEPVESWLADLAEVVGGQRLNDRNVLEPVSYEEFPRIKQRILESTNAGFYGQWGRWFVGDRRQRAISPFSMVAVPKYIEMGMSENTEHRLREVIRLDPTNAVAFARLAVQTLARRDDDKARHVSEAEFHSRRAVELSPGHSEVQRIRANIERQIERLSKP